MKIQIMDSDSYSFLQARSPWIPPYSLHDNGLYVIAARNAYLGIWNANGQGFTIARERFNPQLENRRMTWRHHGWDISLEHHWDIGEPLGTAKPFLLVELIDQLSAENQLAYLLDAQEKLSMVAACELVVG